MWRVIERKEAITISQEHVLGGNMPPWMELHLQAFRAFDTANLTRFWPLRCTAPGQGVEGWPLFVLS